MSRSYAVTALGTARFQRAASDGGFDAFLTKPFDFDRLHDLFSGLLPVKGFFIQAVISRIFMPASSFSTTLS